MRMKGGTWSAHGSRLRRRLCRAFFLGVALLSGCGVVEQTGKIPVVGAVVPRTGSGEKDPAALQAELQRYADESLSRSQAAIDDYARLMGTAEARHQALEWKVTIGSSVVGIVSGPNPKAALVDLLALATLTRTALEEQLPHKDNAQALQPWLRTSLVLETNAWKLADEVFTPPQQREIRDAIERSWVSSAEHNAFFVRPQEVSSLVRQTGEKEAAPGSVFAVVGLDPTAGIDPAVREVTRTRLFAERALYSAQRMPFLLRWQTELLATELLGGAQIAAALTNATSLAQSADRFSRAAETASHTAKALPDRVTEERKAILEALNAQEGKLRELSAELTHTLAAGEKMSTSLNTTIGTFDGLMKRFGVGEPSNGPPNTNSPPFNILDYATTADRLAIMARDLDVLIKDAGTTMDSPAVQQRVEALKAVSEKARRDADAVLNRAFLLGAALIAFTFACAITYRRFAPSRQRGEPQAR